MLFFLLENGKKKGYSIVESNIVKKISYYKGTFQWHVLPYPETCIMEKVPWLN